MNNWNYFNFIKTSKKNQDAILQQAEFTTLHGDELKNTSKFIGFSILFL